MLLVTCWVVQYTNQLSKNNISKMVKLNNTISSFFEWIFDKLSIDTLHFCFSSYWCLKFMEIFESEKVIFFIFSANKMVSNNFVYTYGSAFWEQYCIAWNRFYPRVWKRFFHIESAPSNLSKCQVSRKNKNAF